MSAKIRYIAVAIACSAAASQAASAQTLHFKVTGDYQAKTIIAYQEDGGQATVKDKVVFEFDRDIKTGKVGPIKITNFPSNVSELRNVETRCPPPTPRGNYEHIEVKTVTYDSSGSFEMTGTRSYPDISVTAYCQGSWEKKNIKAKQETVTDYFAMIEGDSPTTFSIKLDNGWTWTYVTTRPGK